MLAELVTGFAALLKHRQRDGLENASSADRQSVTTDTLLADIDAYTKEYFYGNMRCADLREGYKAHLISTAHSMIQEIRTAENPFLTYRERIASWVCCYAEWTVLSMPEEDKQSSVYANCPFISGQLRKDIQLISNHVEKLKKWKWESDGMTDQELISNCTTQGAIDHYFVVCLIYMRIELNDKPSKKDWLIPFTEAMMIWSEDTFRRMAGLPTLLDEMDVMRYSTYMNMVTNGSENPRYEWEQRNASYPSPLAYIPGAWT